MKKEEVKEQILEKVLLASRRQNTDMSTGYNRDYTLTVLFLRYIKDLVADKENGFFEEKGLYQGLDLHEDFDFFELYKKRKEFGNIKRLDRAIKQLEKKNPDLDQVFEEIQFSSLNFDKTEQVLEDLLESFGDKNITLKPSEIGGIEEVGEIYDYLLSNFAKGAGSSLEYAYTPPELSKLLTYLVKPQPGEKIYDPACGSGTLLVRAANYLLEKTGKKDWELFGQESNPRSLRLARLNMFINGIVRENYWLKLSEAFQDQNHKNSGRLQSFDVVISNLFRLSPPDDHKFLKNILNRLNPQSGRMAVIVRHGMLYRNKDEEFRKSIVEQNHLDAVISLPEKLLYESPVPISILFFDNSKNDERILFVDANHGYFKSRGHNLLVENNIDWIKEKIEKRQQSDSVNWVTFEELRKNSFNLMANRYLKEDTSSVDVDINELLNERIKIKNKLILINDDAENIIDDLNNI